MLSECEKDQKMKDNFSHINVSIHSMDEGTIAYAAQQRQQKLYKQI